jgi:hypothetical protein
MLNIIKSGGQTGVDIGALVAARNLGIKTGGWAPKGFLTEDGLKPELAKYNLVETYDPGYITRTVRNVSESDGTIRIATNFESRGEVCTLKAIQKHKKPHLDIHPSADFEENVQKVIEWIAQNQIKTLNVAGNRESVSPGIRDFTVKLITEIIKRSII